MNKEAQRIAIAEACGYPKPFYKSKDIRVGGTMTGTAIWNLPDYLNDLNAMHEAEKVLLEKSDGVSPPDMFDEYCQLLGGSLMHCATATAVQRAEAFLKTLGLWKEEDSSCTRIEK